MKFETLILLLLIFVSIEATFIYFQPSCSYGTHQHNKRSRTYVPPSASPYQVDPQDVISGNGIYNPQHADSHSHSSDYRQPKSQDSSHSTSYHTSSSFQPSSSSEFHQNTCIFSNNQPSEPLPPVVQKPEPIYIGEIKSESQEVYYQPKPIQPSIPQPEPILYAPPQPIPPLIEEKSVKPILFDIPEESTQVRPEPSPYTPTYSSSYYQSLQPTVPTSTPIYSHDNNMKGSDNVLLGSYNQGNGDSNVIAGQLNNLQGNLNVCLGDQNQIKGDENNLGGSKNKCLGDSNHISGDGNYVQGSNNVVLSLQDAPFHY